MSDAELLALFAAAAINAVVPGPGMVLAISRSAAAGSKAGAWITVGMLLATLLLILSTWAVMLGAVTLSDALFDNLGLAGIGVLAILAVVLLRAGPEPLTLPASISKWPRRLGFGDLLGGLATGLSSPVHLLFLLALLPQFVDLRVADATDMALVTFGILVITAVPMLGVTILAARSKRSMRLRPHWISRIGGVAMLGFVGFTVAGLPAPMPPAAGLR